jgi:hypothetical protein
MRATCFLHKRDAQHIGADQHSETANGNGEVDLIHGDPRKTARFNGCNSREPLLTRSLQSDDPIIMGAPLFAAAKRVRKGRRALRRRPLPATAGSRVRFRCDSRHCVPWSYRYLRTTTETIARWYRAIVPRVGPIHDQNGLTIRWFISWPASARSLFATRGTDG